MNDLRICYERLASLAHHVGGVGGVALEIVDDFNSIVAEGSTNAEELAKLHIVTTNGDRLISKLGAQEYRIPADVFRARVAQAVAILKSRLRGHSLPGIAFDHAIAVVDSELRSRAVSLLLRGDHLDQVVNQATQVLEVRLRTLSGHTGKEVGAALVSKVLPSDPKVGSLRVSDDPAEQEGFANLCRGVMQFLRNSAHHHFKPTSREDAERVCVMIDYLLGVLADAKKGP